MYILKRLILLFLAAQSLMSCNSPSMEKSKYTDKAKELQIIMSNALINLSFEDDKLIDCNRFQLKKFDGSNPYYLLCYLDSIPDKSILFIPNGFRYDNDDFIDQESMIYFNTKYYSLIKGYGKFIIKNYRDQMRLDIDSDIVVDIQISDKILSEF